MLPKRIVLSLFLTVSLLLSACDRLADQIPLLQEQPGQPDETVTNPAPVPEVPINTAVTPPATDQELPTEPPSIAEYNLGDFMIAQTPGLSSDELPMIPLQLNGLIGMPTGPGPHPIVLIIHDKHPGCPPDIENGEEIWPCGEGQEQLNFLGFEYLVHKLAEQGYVALAINANAEYTNAYGNAEPGSRLGAIIDQHLGKLVEAGQGGNNRFGADVYGRIDGQRVIWIGHGLGGELAGQIIRDRGLEEAVGAAYAGYGPIRGLLQIAPTHPLGTKSPPADIPFDVILPACDGQDMELRGQYYFEAAREDAGPSGRLRESPATTVLLEQANHNDFNAMAIPDMAAGLTRPECLLDNLPPPDDQRAFLANYAAAFVEWIVGSGQEKANAVAAKGIDPYVPVPEMLFDRQVQIAISPPVANEELILRPFSDSEISRNLRDGPVTFHNLTLTYCIESSVNHEYEGQYTSCHRLKANHLGDPAQMLVQWDQPQAALYLSLPGGGVDLTNHAAFQIRAALDPVNPLNTPGENVSLRVSLTDNRGKTATVSVPQESPALAFPSGDPLPDAERGQPEFTGNVLTSTIRLPLDQFSGVDLSAIEQVILHFDQPASGALFLADIAFVRPEHYPGSYSTVLINDGSLDHLRGIGRFHGASSCTAALLDTGAPEAPAVILTNGHCAQQWSADEIHLDLPADSMQVVFNYFANTRGVQIPVAATRVLYSTMNGRDIALVELAATLGDLQKRDIFPFPLAADPPFSADSVTVLGAPVAELPPAETYLRREECAISGRASVMEFEWQFDHVYRLNCQDIYSGSSGSPLFLDDGNEIFALLNTTTIGGETPCDLNAPCEMTATGPVFRYNTSYATPVDGIGACFTSDGYFELLLPGCPLDDGQ